MATTSAFSGGEHLVKTIAAGQKIPRIGRFQNTQVMPLDINQRAPF